MHSGAGFIVVLKVMQHNCGPICECKRDLSLAAVGLAEASKLLSESILFDSDDFIETYYALVRAAKAKFLGARAAYNEHCASVAAGSAASQV